LRKWRTDGSAEADARVGRIEWWCVEHGHMRLANLIAKVKVWFR
jgi:hypothetical protein